MSKYVAVLAVALVLSVSGALGLARDTGDTGSTPPAAPVATGSVVAPANQDLAGTIDALQTRLRDLPKDAESWATLALAYVEQARITGNPAFYPKAEEAVARSLEERPSGNAGAHASSAALAAARHDFTRALAEADAALAVNGREAGALAVRVDALTELGRYRAQDRALRVADSRQPGVPVAARYSYLLELRGDLRGATRVLLRSAQGAPHADRGFLFTQVAELDRRRGELGAARRHVRLALREAPGYVPALVSGARLAVAEGRLAAAERRWSEVVGRLPLAEYLTEYGELLLAMGRDEDARAQFDVVRTTVQLLKANGVDADLETALFEADHGDPGRAVELASAEYAARKSIHVADALAWALHTEGRDAEALPLAARATRLGTEEARLWLHRGLIESALGRDDDAVRHLRRGLQADPGASPWQAQRARAEIRRLEAGR